MNLEKICLNYSRQQAAEAVYFAVRAIKQSELDAESRKEHLQDASENSPSPEVASVTGAIIAEIEAEAGTSIADLTKSRRKSYLTKLLAFSKRLNNESNLIDLPRGRKLLDKLRNQALDGGQKKQNSLRPRKKSDRATN